MLVMIHGLGDEADSWSRLFPLLADEGYRVLAPDLPGFGRSVRKGRISIANHAKAIPALLEACGAVKEYPAVLCGSSMGAVVAGAAACARPDLSGALILLDGCFPMAGKFDPGMVLMALPFIGKKWYRAFRHDPEGAWKSLYPFYNKLDAMTAADKNFLRERVMARVESASQERAYFASLRSLMGLGLFGGRSFSRRIQNYPGKILVLWGAEDKIFKPEATRDFLALRPDAVFKTIAGGGHLVHQEKPKETAAAILEFISNLS
jgi:pimeloyl-ACP methyl ester carboxylesterase